jgi:glycosyltransferase involved in cell wall biosynthesis
VIVPCFNHGHYLAEALNSVRRQTYANWECLILDDGSSDDTSQVASRFVEQDSRYRYLHHANCGLAATRNWGISACRGEFIQFLDADDVVLEHKFELQVAALSQRDALTIIHCDYSRGRSDCITEKVKGGYRPPTFIYRKPLYDIALRWETELSIPVHCFLIDARAFRNHAIRFDESLPTHEDWDCWMRIFALEPESVFIDKVLAIYRSSGPGSQTNHRDLMHRGFELAWAKQASIWSQDPILSRLLKLKRRKIEQFYEVYLRDPSPLQDWLEHVYSRSMPWPIQQVVTRLKEQRLKPDKLLLSEISRTKLVNDSRH